MQNRILYETGLKTDTRESGEDMGFFSKHNEQDVQESPNVCAVLVAAGGSTRMQGIQKQLAPLCGMPVLMHSVHAFEYTGCVREIVIVAREEDILPISDFVSQYGFSKVTSIVKGGSSRQA